MRHAIMLAAALAAAGAILPAAAGECGAGPSSSGAPSAIAAGRALASSAALASSPISFLGSPTASSGASSLPTVGPAAFSFGNPMFSICVLCCRVAGGRADECADSCSANRL